MVNFFILLFALQCVCIFPVIMFHGFNGHSTDWDHFNEFFQKHSPDTRAYALNYYEGHDSWTPLEEQMPTIIKMVEELKKNESIEEFNIIGHSQGAVLARAYLEMVPNHGVQSFVSLGGVHRGYFGLPQVEEYFPKFLLNLTLTEISDLMYTKIMQKKCSFAGYWHDPSQPEKFLKLQGFLSTLDNQTYNPHSHEYKRNFIELKLMVCIVGPGDQTIKPWQTGRFDFYEEGDPEVMLDMKSGPVYVNDNYGLRTLDERNGIIRYEIPGIVHSDWIKTEEVFVNNVLPHLK